MGNLIDKNAAIETMLQLERNDEEDYGASIPEWFDGARAGGNSCFTGDADKQAIFRPIFWFKNEDKRFYEEKYGIVHSRCYTEYGLKRTGCVGCPFGQNWQFELEVAKKYEPKLYTLCNAVFGKSYEYALKYQEFRKQMEKRKE